jgi:lipopolysaccharide transport system ATP-binding protein
MFPFCAGKAKKSKKTTKAAILAALQREEGMVRAVRVEGLGKRYRLEGGGGDCYRYRSLREDLARWAKVPLRLLRGGTSPKGEDFWALREISFELESGEVLGIIGRNGAGKSTLLKVLSRITSPTTGHVELRGRVGSLLEVGTGFHPELTGRENVFLNGSILGMTRREIGRKFDEIVAFAEVEKFLDTPVKRYSSGMYVRLAFAVAAHLEPEILIVDEVLAVGDAAFQKKCLNKMGDAAGQGRTILFVSHNMGAVQNLCRRGVLLEHGRVQMLGTAREVAARYLAASEAAAATPLDERRDRTGEGRFRFEEVILFDAAGRPRAYAVTGEDLYLKVRLRVSGDGPLPAPLEIGIAVREPQGLRITELASHFTGESPTTGAAAREITCYVPRLPLLPASYRLDLWCGVLGETEDYLLDAAVLRVEPGNYFRNDKDARVPETDKNGYCMVPQQWGVQPPPISPGGPA